MTVTGAQASIELTDRTAEHATVGKFVGLQTDRSIIIGLITEVGEQTLSAGSIGVPPSFRKMARLDQTLRNHPRYSFMFENANIGGDTMAEILGSLFRMPTATQADGHHVARRLSGRGG